MCNVSYLNNIDSIVKGFEIVLSITYAALSNKIKKSSYINQVKLESIENNPLAMSGNTASNLFNK